jgi:hypothetical protein
VVHQPPLPAGAALEAGFVAPAVVVGFPEDGLSSGQPSKLRDATTKSTTLTIFIEASS